MLQGIDNEIKDILLEYVKINSNTGTKLELKVENFLMDYFSNIQYWKENNQLFGTYKIENDLLERSVCWAMVKGEGEDAIVLIHHYDVVDIEDFKHLKPFAYSPFELEAELLKIKDNFNDEIKQDLESGAFLYGRGATDMKGGGAIQLALLRRYSEIKDFKGNIILIAVPDEENLSSGMRGAVKLLDEIKNKYALNYLLMINSEPHLRKNKDIGVFSEGSVGKLMPFVYVRGYLSHIGKVFQGFNPIKLLSEIERRTDLNIELSDFINNEASPPPTWLYLKDSKKQYDVSLPLSAFGCLSILTLDKTPGQVMGKLNNICVDAFESVIKDMNTSYERYMVGMGEKYKPLPWEPKVVSFKSLYQEAFSKYGNTFDEYYQNTIKRIKEELSQGKITILDGSAALVEAVYDYIDDLSPRIVIGLTPPYYPNVSNLFFDNLSQKVSKLSEWLKDYSVEKFKQNYSTEYFFTGISDMSYTSIKNGADTIKTLENNMPFFGNLYEIPIEAIERISMPCINIGPWGKDFHKLTERVCKRDLLSITPELLNHAISYMLDWERQK
jgi:arginine utilization protein RocB